MGIKKCDAKYTKPFVGKTDVIVMISVEGGQSIASATQLDYDTVHALEKTIVDCTFIDDEPQTETPTNNSTISEKFQLNDEPQIPLAYCETCKHDLWNTPRTCGKCTKQEDGKPSMYEPKDEQSGKE